MIKTCYMYMCIYIITKPINMNNEYTLMIIINKLLTIIWTIPLNLPIIPYEYHIYLTDGEHRGSQ